VALLVQVRHAVECWRAAPGAAFVLAVAGRSAFSGIVQAIFRRRRGPSSTDEVSVGYSRDLR
jgi:hypothetical protein